MKFQHLIKESLQISREMKMFFSQKSRNKQQFKVFVCLLSRFLGLVVCFFYYEGTFKQAGDSETRKGSA